ncbi:SDR family NAD(P)-dependent oxidoreductase [Paenibacillus sp. LMG 31459]|uniref:SDR family NAD(P)-dependent oxidoreductase n=1 Tax=Paenibacillus phytohabitans TaxID=2654978 RepID=A0ABX1YAT6_9BACL|nr:SDR family NAD(P)-dependent oxidoreductase [Paenibacillus phytohabitans]
MDSIQSSKAYTLITGASGGIGQKLAEEFAKKKANLVCIARRADALKATTLRLMECYPIQVLWLSIDLTEK